MGNQPSSVSQQTGKTGKACKPRTSKAGSERGYSQEHHHFVNITQAALLTDGRTISWNVDKGCACSVTYTYGAPSQNQSESKRLEIKQKTGADVELDPDPSANQNTKAVIIRGFRHFQIEAAVRLINQETNTQETISAQAQTFWQQWVEAAFPDIDSRAYFLPPVYFNRVPMTRQSTAGLDVLVLREPPGQASQSTSGQAGQSTPGQSGQCNQQAMNPSVRLKNTQLSNVQDSDVRDDAAMQRFLFCLQKMYEKNREVLVGLSQLQFGQYLGEPCYAAAAAHLPVAGSLPAALSKNNQGDFDVLLIHRQYGIVVCEVKSLGDNVDELNMSQQDIDKNIRSKLRNAVLQLDKAEAMLSHLVSDVTPGLRITKTIVIPNLTARQVQQAISGDPKLMQDLCRCLGTTDPADITGVCVCSDQLSDPKTLWKVSSDVLRELGNWWQRRVTVSGPDRHMTCDNYKTLVARFCGPATTVTVPCTSPPRLCVKTLGQAVSWTGDCYTAQISLFPEQLQLVNMVHPRVYVAGPPGTGKTVVLLLKATEWMRCGDDVCIVSTYRKSRAACSMLYQMLLQIVNTQLTSVISPGKPHLRQYAFDDGEDEKDAVNDLSLAARSGSLYVIADEVPGWDGYPQSYDGFKTFCDKLLTQVPGLRLWATSCYHGDAPTGWHVERLTRPLRSPPAVVREVMRDEAITLVGNVLRYSKRGVPDHTDGPPVRRLYHRGQGHSGDRPHDCVTCGREVASFLQSLRFPADVTPATTVTTINSSAVPPCVQWRDVLVLCTRAIVWDQSGVVTGLREGHVPVRVMEDDDTEDVATARSDVVWVADEDDVRGLERKVVVCLDPDCGSNKYGLHSTSRCTSQLVILSL